MCRQVRLNLLTKLLPPEQLQCACHVLRIQLIEGISGMKRALVLPNAVLVPITGASGVIKAVRRRVVQDVSHVGMEVIDGGGYLRF